MTARLKVGDREFDTLTEATMYQEALNYMMSARSGKNSYIFHQGKWYHIDRNFNPPKVEEIKE